MITGIGAKTCDRFLVDAGAVYIGFQDFDNPGDLLGATRGGSSLAIEQEIVEIPVDGAHGPVKGCRRVVNTKTSLTVNLIEHTLDNLKLALVGSTNTDFNTFWDAIVRNNKIQDTDYLDNVTIVGEISGHPKATAIKLDNVLVDSNFELTFSDKEEGVLAVTFTAHFDPNDLINEPWSLYWPKSEIVYTIFDSNIDRLIDSNGDTLVFIEEQI